MRAPLNGASWGAKRHRDLAPVFELEGGLFFYILASAFAAHQCLATEPDGSGMRRFGLHKRRLRANSSGMQDHSTLAMLALLVGAWVIVVAVGWWLQ